MNNKNPQNTFLEIRKQLRKIEKANFEYSTRLQKNFTITRQQIAVLKFIFYAPGISLSELALGIGAHITTVEGIVNRLYKNSFVKKQKNKKDKRLVEMFIAPKGKKIIQEAPVGPMGKLLKNLKKASAEDLQQISTGLTKLVDFCGASNIDVEQEKKIVRATLRTFQESDPE